MRVSTHAGLLRSDGGVIDSQQRMLWALDTLSSFEVDRSAEVKAEASLSTIAGAHAPAYLLGLDALAAAGGAQLDPELHFNAEMWRAARCACTGLVAAATANTAEPMTLCLSRPGSHHAGPHYALGGCVLNNLAVAASTALAHGRRKVAIVDFDAHHGNGTQEIFWAEERVLCVSLHQYPFFPGSGAADETGAGKARGTTLNLPLAAGSRSSVALEAYDRALERVQAFGPDLVLFEAGFDGHSADWTTGLCFDEETFFALGARTSEALRALAVPAVFELGGGYSESALRGGLDALLDGLGVRRCPR